MLWCWRRLLRVPWTARRSNQLILKEISPEYSLEGLMLKPKLQYFGHLMGRTDSFEKTWCRERLRQKEKGMTREWDGWMASLTEWTWVWANCRRWWRTGKPGMMQSMGWQRVGHDWGTEQQKETWDKVCRGLLRLSLLLDVVLCGNEIPDLAKDGRENNEGNDTRGVKLGREVEQ